MASEQDQDPAIGLVHASYSQSGYGLLGASGIGCDDRKAAAAREQARWAAVIRQCFGGGADVGPLANAAIPEGSPRDMLGALRGVCVQADRNLLASDQTTDPAIGMVHASYAQAGYELLMVAGIQCRDRMGAAGRQQDRWGTEIRRCFGKTITPTGVCRMPPGLPSQPASVPPSDVDVTALLPRLFRPYRLVRIPDILSQQQAR